MGVFHTLTLAVSCSKNYAEKYFESVGLYYAGKLEKYT